MQPTLREDQTIAVTSIHCLPQSLLTCSKESFHIFYTEGKSVIPLLLSLLLALAPLPLNNGKIIPDFRNLLTEKFQKTVGTSGITTSRAGKQPNLHVRNPMKHQKSLVLNLSKH